MEKGFKKDLLNHGFIRYVDHMGSDLSVVRNARVSYDAEWRAGENEGSDAKLLNYLWKNRHSTPFESATVTFDIKAPIFVFRQWHRHRTQCSRWNTKLIFDLPGGKSDSKYRPFTMTIKEFHDKWHGGAKAITSLKKEGHCVGVDAVEEYSVSQLAVLTDRRPETIRNLCREGTLAHTRVKPSAPRDPAIFIKGEDWINWANEKRTVMSMQSRLAGMKLRSYNEDTGEIYHTNVVDVWKSGKKQLYRVHVGNDYIDLSAEHPLLTDKGWRCVKELLQGDLVHVQRWLGNGAKNELPEIDIKKEKWKKVSGSKLSVSSQGRVKSNGKLVDFSNWESGYYGITIDNENKLLHRVIWETFNGAIKDGSFVLHDNDNSWDNRLSNLKLGDAKANAEDRIKNGKQQQLVVQACPINSIEKIGYDETYDIEVAGPYHNFIANNFCTHNSYNELSARYRELPEEFYVPDISQITTQSKDNKQMRSGEENQYAAEIHDIIGQQCTDSFDKYRKLTRKRLP